MQPLKERPIDVWKTLINGPRNDFPRGPAPDSALLWRPWTLALLLLACLAPRAIAAWNWDVLWSDSVHYLRASVALEHGDLDRGFAEFGLNIFPLILIPLRHLGVDWQIAGKWFSVLMATCTVLPLWGWLRRMFDDRLALIACLVYALHGKLIAISPLIVRDSTYWFLLVLTLYYFWRAVGELRMRLFLAAGMALTLSIFTRTEGWLLLVPLLGWSAYRWWTAKYLPSPPAPLPRTGEGSCFWTGPKKRLQAEGRPKAVGATAGSVRIRLAAGILLCLAVVPATVTVLNCTWLREHPRWEFFRTAHLRIAVAWLNKTAKTNLPVPPEDVAPPEPPAVMLDQYTPSGTLTFKFLERLAKACTWIGGLLLLTGLARGWRILLRPEHLALGCMNLLLLITSRIRYGTVGLDSRYFMPLVIVAIPWMALGLEGLVAAACHWFQRRAEVSPRALYALAGGLIALAVVCSLVDGPLPAAACMRKHAALGRWIYDRAGPEPAVAGNLDVLDTFYAHGHLVDFLTPGDCLLARMPAALAERKADAVVLWNDEHLARERFAVIGERVADRCGYHRVDAKELPAAENELMVFVR
jgi:hypothetical protein